MPTLSTLPQSLLSAVMVLAGIVIAASASFALAGATGFDLRVGTAAVDLAADDSMVIAGGIGPGRAKGQEGRLRAVAVVVQGPRGNRIAIVACDVLFTPRDIVDPALAEIERTTGIPAANVLVNATHTHHAPSTVRVHGCEREEKFCTRLREGIVSAVQQADASAKDHRSQFLFDLGEEKTVGANSRLLLKDGRIYWIGSRAGTVRPTGPFDPQLPVLAFRGPDGMYRTRFTFLTSGHIFGLKR